MSTVVRCSGCAELLAEPSDPAPEKREPCRDCGSTARTFEVGLTAISVGVAIQAHGTVTGAPGDDVNVHPGTGVLRLEGDAPTPRIEQFEDAGFRLSWLRLLPGGAVMVQVFDASGEFIDGSIQDDPEAALLTVAERLLPPPT